MMWGVALTTLLGGLYTDAHAGLAVTLDANESPPYWSESLAGKGMCGEIVAAIAREAAGIILEESYSQASLFKKLMKGRVDLVVEINLVGQSIILNQLSEYRQRFVIDRLAHSASPVAILLAENQPNSPLLAKEIRKGLKHILDSGEYERIVSKYYENGSLPESYLKDLNRFRMIYQYQGVESQ